MKLQECKILAQLEKQTRFAVKGARLRTDDTGIAVQILADKGDIFLL
jgi:hypothetical protein